MAPIGSCRVCGRKLQGKQRRWLFRGPHVPPGRPPSSPGPPGSPAASPRRPELHVALAHVTRCPVRPGDGASPFACSKCAFMLERVYRYDAVGARVQALSLQHLRRLLREKEQLVQCLLHLYGRTQGPIDGTIGDDVALADARYDALLRADLELSAFECWAEPGPDTSDGPPCRGRRCACCSGLRVPDWGYESVCGVPRRLQHGTNVGAAATFNGAVSPSGEEDDTEDCCSASLLVSASVCSDGAGSEVAPFLAVPDQEESPFRRDDGSFLNSTDLSKASSAGELVPDGAIPSHRCPLLQGEHHSTTFSSRCLCRDLDNSTQAPLSLAENPDPGPCPLSEVLHAMRDIGFRPVRGAVGSRLPVLVRLPTIVPATRGSPPVPNALKHTPSPAPPSVPPPCFRRLGADDNDDDDDDRCSLYEELIDDLCEEYLPFQCKKMTEEREEEAGRLQRSAGEMAAALAKAQAEARELQEHVRQLESAGKELQEKLAEMASELRTQEQNALKRDRAIQGLSLAMKAKDKEISELCEELENRDAALVKARDATHKAQLQKFHGAEEQHALLTQKEEELCELRAATQRSLTETQRAQRALRRADERLADATAQRDAAEEEKEGAVLERQRAERGVQELRSELERAKRERRERELELVQEHESHRRDCEHRLASHELLVRRLTDSLADRDRLLQEYTELLRGSDQLPDGKGTLIAALQQRLNEQHQLLERADEARSAALQHKEAEIVELRRELAERSRDLERLRALLAGKDETIQGLDELMRERDAELQRLASALKETRRARDEAGEALDGSLADAERARALLAQRETELEAARQALLERAEVGAQELVRQLTERLADKERLLEQALSEGGRPGGDAPREGRRLAELLAQLRDKEECLEAERAERARQQREMEQLRRRLAEAGGERWTEREGDAERVKEGDPGQETLTHVELGRLHAVLQEKDSIIHRLVENGQEKDRLLTLVQAPPRTLELKQTLRILKDERDKETRQNLLGEEEEEEEDDEDDVGCHEEDEEDEEEEEEGGDDDRTVPPRAVRRRGSPAAGRAALRHPLASSPEASRSQGALRPTQEVELLNKEVDRLTQEVHRLTQEVLLLRVRSPRNPVGAKPETGSDAHELLLMEQEQEGGKLQQLLHAEQQVYQHLAALPQHADSRSLQEELARVRTLRLQLLDGLRANRELRHNLEELSRELETSPGVSAVRELALEVDRLRQQLEESQRWNASLQGRLGLHVANNDTARTDSLVSGWNQTSYMSFQLAEPEGLEEELLALPLADLRNKALQLTAQLKDLHLANQELERKVGERELANQLASCRLDEAENERKQMEDEVRATRRRMEEVEAMTRMKEAEATRRRMEEAEEAPREMTQSHRRLVLGSDGSDGDVVALLEKQVEGLLADLAGTRAHLRDAEGRWRQAATRLEEVGAQNDELERELEGVTACLEEEGFLSFDDLREELRRLRRSPKAREGKEGAARITGATTEDVDASGKPPAPEPAELVQRLSDAERVNELLRRQLEMNTSVDGDSSFNPDLIVGMACEIERLNAELGAIRQHQLSAETDRCTSSSVDRSEGGAALGEEPLSPLSPLSEPPPSPSRVVGSKAGRKSRLPVPKRPKVSAAVVAAPPPARCSAQSDALSSPMSGHAMLSEGHVTISGGHVMPTAGHMISVEGHVMPVGGHTPPAGSHATPAGTHATAIEGHAAPAGRHVTSAGARATTPGGADAAQREGGAGPCEADSSRVELEHMRAALEDYKKQNRALEERLLLANNAAAPPGLLAPPPSGEASLACKGVQVEVQDLGYETCGRSEAEDYSGETPPGALAPGPGRVAKCPGGIARHGSRDAIFPAAGATAAAAAAGNAAAAAGDAAAGAVDAPGLRRQVEDLNAQLGNYRQIVRELQARQRGRDGDGVAASADVVGTDGVGGHRHGQPKAVARSDSCNGSDSAQGSEHDGDGTPSSGTPRSPAVVGVGPGPSRGDLSRPAQNGGDPLEGPRCAADTDGGRRDGEESDGSPASAAGTATAAWMRQLSREAEREVTRLMGQVGRLEEQLHDTKRLNRQLKEQLRGLHGKRDSSGSAGEGPRLDSLVQAQARDLSELRQRLRLSARLCGELRERLCTLTKALEELLSSGDVDYYAGEGVRKQLGRTAHLMDKLLSRINSEGAPDGGRAESGDKDDTVNGAGGSLQHEVAMLRKQLETERRHLTKKLQEATRRSEAQATHTHTRIERLEEELLERDRLIEDLQQQLSSPPPSPSACDDRFLRPRSASGSGRSSHSRSRAGSTSGSVSGSDGSVSGSAPRSWNRSCSLSSERDSLDRKSLAEEEDGDSFQDHYNPARGPGERYRDDQRRAAPGAVPAAAVAAAVPRGYHSDAEVLNRGPCGYHGNGLAHSLSGFGSADVSFEQRGYHSDTGHAGLAAGHHASHHALAAQAYAAAAAAAAGAPFGAAEGAKNLALVVHGAENRALDAHGCIYANAPTAGAPGLFLPSFPSHSRALELCRPPPLTAVPAPVAEGPPHRPGLPYTRPPPPGQGRPPLGPHAHPPALCLSDIQRELDLLQRQLGERSAEMALAGQHQQQQPHQQHHEQQSQLHHHQQRQQPHGAPGWQGGAAKAFAAPVAGETAPPARDTALRERNETLHERLRGAEELNATLRAELELHHSLLGSPGQGQLQGARSGQGQGQGWAREAPSPRNVEQPTAPSPVFPSRNTAELLEEHLREIRALRRRLEESILTNEQLRRQLEQRLADSEHGNSTNIYIQRSEENRWHRERSGPHDAGSEEEAVLREALLRKTEELEQLGAELDASRSQLAQRQSELDAARAAGERLRRELEETRARDGRGDPAGERRTGTGRPGAGGSQAELERVLAQAREAAS
ncbi:myomegalin-like isoform X2 [Lethenteron reissneri]|uniref:myomegalin-like isoform X2 n=1 Tax=Lethenteron reissneri TaxID=7753 RepID=UPI002AB5F381|nr:myomegalin-like isoform X2 [Lethenteron reissneri]